MNECKYCSPTGAGTTRCDNPNCRAPTLDELNQMNGISPYRSPHVPEYKLLSSHHSMKDLEEHVNSASGEGFEPLMMTGTGSGHGGYVFVLMVRR
jgi:hypothetical protein